MLPFSAFGLTGLPISVTLCLPAAVNILQTDNTLLIASFPTQMFAAWTAVG